MAELEPSKPVSHAAVDSPTQKQKLSKLSKKAIKKQLNALAEQGIMATPLKIQT